ncbi:hypothetical protein [Oricola nitratireducens]|uniref:hypothetical protein n=1 Tax=Oricola nitratireducens TaxID=2775868 RepID=UPI0018673872|nr:hypothetical protein [Oricola nitratireducens]
MQTQTEEKLLEVLVEMRNWLRIAVREPVRAALEAALPDAKSRAAYQMFDGSSSVEQVRVACKMSPNAVVALAARCTSIGLMEATPEKKRIRLFDLRDFDLLETDEASKAGGKE